MRDELGMGEAMRMNPAECRRLLADNPANLLALQHLAYHLRDDGDGIQAMRLYRRAYTLHGDKTAFDQQAEATLPAALNQISMLLDPGRFDEAAVQLEWLAGFMPPSGHLARLLATVWLIQGREGDAAAMLAHMDLPDPADTGIAVALAALDTHRRHYSPIGTVVIPAFRAADTIVESLDSILATLARYRQETGRADAQVHIVVVDDASPDDTVETVRRWGRAHPEQGMALIVNNQNRGAGRARNAGAAAALGPYLWFLDADDRYLEWHFVLTALLLDRNSQLDYVRTDMVFDRIDDQVTQVWREASQRTYPCNLCIRLPAHNRTGGFPEETPFWPAVADDVVYSRALAQILDGALIDEKTVFYRMRPGNVLDKLQQEMMSGRAPGEGAVVDARFMAIEILTRRRLYALEAEQAAARKAQAQTASGLLALARERTGAGDHAAALDLLRRAVDTAPDLPAAWFERGMAAHRLSRREEAVEAFTRAVGLTPDLPAARVNLGMILLEEGAAADALPHLQRAADLKPAHANSRFLLARALRRLGLRAEAAVHLRQALALLPDRAEYLAEWAGLLLETGGADAALAAADRAAAVSPGLYDAHAARASALEALARKDEALAAWDRAIACNAGYGEAFTRRALLLLDAQWGPPPRPRAAVSGNDRRLALTRLGSNGRFGNQLLQYGVARLYAQRHGLTLETPPWLGRHLFDLDDPLPGPALPRLSEAKAGLPAGLAPDMPPHAAGHDIDGYFCGDTTPLAPFAEDFRGYFTRGRHWSHRMEQIGDRLREAGDTLVGLHLRRGDFGWGPFWIAPEAWYLDWLDRLWPTLTRPALYIATDDPALAGAFARYRPLTAAGLGTPPLPGAPFLDDFQALCQSDILGISNSTFSFSASLLNRRAQAFYRPNRENHALVPYRPWSSIILLD